MEEASVKFESLGLSESLLLRLQDLGYLQATDVQAQALPLLLKGKDAAVQVRGNGRLRFCMPDVRKSCFLDGPYRQACLGVSDLQ